MRLRRLDLTRYGRFTDQTFDFGAPVAGEPDLHLIYGPNEAGKSTAFSGFLDLLFGIEPRSRYNFLHPYSAMRIGACLEIGGNAQELRRIKRPQNSLLDGADQIVGEHVIRGCLGGIDRDAYRAMFSLDDETLEAGGETILASKGDLGELLFSATAGLADLSQRLIDLRAEADGFHKLHARTSELAGLKARLGELKEARAKIDIAASDYARLVKAHDDALAAYENAVAARAATEQRIGTLQRTIAALPRMRQLRELREQIAQLAHLPEAPVEWREAMPGLQETETTLAVRLEQSQNEIVAREAALAAILVDEVALQLADRVAGWATPRARALTAEADIPEREQELRSQELAIAGLLARLGQANHARPRDLLLPASVTGALRELLERRSGVQAAFDTATHELDEATRQLEEALQASGGTLPEAGIAEEKLAAVAAAVKSWQAQDYDTRVAVAERLHRTQIENAQEALGALRPWEGDLDALASLAAPDAAKIAGWKNAVETERRKLEKYREQLVECNADLVRREAERNVLSDIAGVVDDRQAAAIRSARETEWAAHRRTLDLASADRFEQALRQDDLVTGARGRHEADIAKLREVTQRLAVLQAEAGLARQGVEEACAQIEATEGEIRAAIVGMAPALAAGMTLAQFEAWLGRRETALQIRAKLKEAAKAVGEARADAARGRLRVAKALEAGGIAHDSRAETANLIEVAQNARDNATKQRALRDKIDARAREVKTRELALAKARKAAQDWQDEWAKSCGGCWLRDVEADLHIGTVRETLPLLGDLASVLDQADLLRKRIGDMRDDHAAFAAETAKVAAGLGVSAAGTPPLELDRRITGMVQVARAARDRREAAREKLAAARKAQHDLFAEQEIHLRKRGEICEFLSVESLREADAALRDIERKRDLQQHAAAAERDLIDALGVLSIEQAEALLDEADRAALAAELAALQSRFEDQDRRKQELYAEQVKAQDRLAAVGGDAAAAQLDGRRKTILLEIEEGAQRYLKRRIGVAATEHALRAYRTRHRSAMMIRASEAFRTMSRGAYGGLDAQPKKDGEFLVALAAAGGSKIASDLSKGTRFQLYLALRVAGYHEFAAQREPVPFIADDIMETFDDFRAEEALGLFADMAKVGQVIYMTHHRHLCDIATRICPAIRIHELAA